MKVVGIDSMVLIYAKRIPVVSSGNLSAKQIEELAELRRRSELLLRYLGRKKCHVVLPSIAIAELLVKVPEIDKGSLIATLSKRFVCPSFDLRSAAIASRLWAEFKALPADQQYSDRNVLKADAMIIGSAIAAGATLFYSHDLKARKMADLMIKGRDLPTRDPDGGFDFPDSDDSSGHN